MKHFLCACFEPRKPNQLGVRFPRITVLDKLVSVVVVPYTCQSDSV